MYLLLKCNLFLGYNSFFMSICYSCLETAQVEIAETVAISKLFQDALECVIGDEINNITVEEVETRGNKLVALGKQFCPHPRCYKRHNFVSNLKRELWNWNWKKYTNEEEQTLYCVEGFIVFSMKRKYENILEENSKSISASNALNFLKSLKNMDGQNIQEQFLKEFIKMLTEQTSRGGLIQPNADYQTHWVTCKKSNDLSIFM